MTPTELILRLERFTALDAVLAAAAFYCAYRVGSRVARASREWLMRPARERDFALRNIPPPPPRRPASREATQ